MADNEPIYKFKCFILSRLQEWGRCHIYSFSTKDENIPTVEKTKVQYKQHNKLKTANLYGKIKTFDHQLVKNAPYIIEARITEEISRSNGLVYKNLVANKIYPVLDVEGQDEFLKAIVSEQRYNTIIEHYPKFVDMVINDKEIDISKLKNIGPKVFEKIQADVKGNYWKADIMKWLIPLDVTDKMINKLLGKYKSPLILKHKLTENPYVLTEIHGLGFIRVDEIVLKMFPDKKESVERLRAFIEYILFHTAYKMGDTVVFLSQLQNAVHKHIPECDKLFVEYIERDDNNLHFVNESLVGLKYFYDLEKGIFDRLKFLNEQFARPLITNKNWIKDTEKMLGFPLSEEQIKVVEATTEHNFIMVTGNAGVGKTTIVKAILTAYHSSDIGLCSLSAKAAQRIKEVTGVNAYTVHRLLKFNGKRFYYTENNPLNYLLVILDEGSMIDTNVLKALIYAVKPGYKFIMVGDDGQLPPIGAGNVFQDLLQSEFKICRLTHIYRQALKSGIIVDANLVRQGINPFKQ